ncbi:extracellular solute-binding protein [Spelaeicoccus albus]|uniref:Molybdate/tungstate transport system substrate-binding protein n=1 Tax=Spelaeicoccus albus TaxID=1280376 RepID=A0A7Z0D151_9MICO|nr:extracellular solute-binding protein [Spelaeicoccus albus]NYI66353.1 molybdate/tungstate transport system substrate-binding protein [Spelaeicoccus albus]
MLRRSGRFSLLATTLACALVFTAGCSSDSPSASGSTPTSASKGSGPVTVLYAGSLVNMMEKQLSPGFDKSSGYTFKGYGAGSSALAEQIKGKVHKADVFISANPDVNDTLEGKKNGNWVSWYAKFASSPLVIGYNPKSKFAADIKSKPWYTVITESGFHVGRTDPATDPKGELAAQALKSAATKHHDDALAAIGKDKSTVLPEETMVGRLQSGQLDAGFFYSSEAKAAGIPTVPLTGQNLKAVYTVTQVNNAPHPKAAAAFIKYLLGSNGKKILKKDAFDITSPPAVKGSDVPSALTKALGQ